MAFFSQAIALDPNFAPGHYGYALALQWDIWHFSSRPFLEVQETAREEAQMAVSLDDKDACLVVCSGSAAIERKHSKVLQQAMRASPHDPLIWLWLVWRGLLQFFSRDFIAALQTLRQVARLRPGYAVTYQYIAASLAYLGRSDEAREALERVPPQSAEQLQRWQQRPPWLRPEDYALRVEGVRLAAGERG